jgi:hypothetical protein
MISLLLSMALAGAVVRMCVLYVQRESLSSDLSFELMISEQKNEEIRRLALALDSGNGPAASCCMRDAGFWHICPVHDIRLEK